MTAEINIPPSYTPAEVALPPEVVTWWLGQDGFLEEVGLDEGWIMLNQCFRYSPLAIRGLILSFANGIYTQYGHILPPSPQFRYNAAAFGYFAGLLTKEEFQRLVEGETLRTRLPQTESDLWMGPRHPLVHNRIYPTLEEVSVNLERERQSHRNLKVIFFHGKWNGFPHPGHILGINDAVSKTLNETNTPEADLKVVVACDTNTDIRVTTRPFLTTAWRLSLMSYLPWVDYLCTSGNFTGKSHTHWLYKYQLLAPDFIHIEADDPLRKRKTQQAFAAGAQVILGRRVGQYALYGLGQPQLRQIPGQPIASSHLWSGSVASNKGDWLFTHPYNRLFAIRWIRDQLYGSRQWFS